MALGVFDPLLNQFNQLLQKGLGLLGMNVPFAAILCFRPDS